METNEIKIYEGQHLADVYPLIESNIILNKRLSGVGATHCEIIAPRNSIIVVPNIPIITCKVERHKNSDNLFGVMQYVSERDITKYLERTISQNKNIKIMVTPESFDKIRRAFDEMDINLYETCFLLLDECHKFIKERDFRQDITLPFKTFFKFKEKALVSATPITPSDPRFIEQNFKIVKIVPQYSCHFEIILTTTDDLKLAFYDDMKGVGKKFMPTEPQCIFINSISIIKEIILESKLNEISSIFCSEQSAVQLKKEGFKNVHTEWKPAYEKPFMFFTSRFYTGLDIWLDTQPRVLYFTDSLLEQTLMDPFTDMAQACGRFRNGMKEIHHYVIYNPKFNKRTRAEIEEYLNGIKKSIKALEDLYETSNSQEEKNAILSIIKKMDFSDIFYEGEIDYFLKDNIIENEKVKSYYTDFDTLKLAYAESEYFKMPWETDAHLYHKWDARPFIKKKNPRKFQQEQNKVIVETLDLLSPYKDTFEISEIINNLRSINKTLVKAYFILGSEFIRNVDYSEKKIKDALANKKLENNGYNEDFLQALYSTFIIGKKYYLEEAKKRLQRLYDKFNMTPPSKITAQSLKWHFEVRDTARIGDSKAIEIISPKLKNSD